MSVENTTHTFEEDRSWAHVIGLIVGTLLIAIGGAAIPHSWEALRSDSRWSPLILALLMIVVGALAPLAVTYLQKIRTGTTESLALFAGAMPDFIKPLNQYLTSPMLPRDAKALRERLVSQAASALGDRVRVCVYKFIQQESDKLNEGTFVLDVWHGRPGVPRKSFSADTEEGKQFISAIAEKQRPVVVHNIKHPPPEMTNLNANQHNGYGSFVVFPIMSLDVDGSPTHKVKGAVTIDYPDRRRFLTQDRDMYHCIARIFEAGFSSIKRGGIDTKDVIPQLRFKLKELQSNSEQRPDEEV